ncbi:MAG: hypothetical protein R2880_03445 [Deinococcales bacterium]
MQLLRTSDLAAWVYTEAMMPSQHRARARYPWQARADLLNLLHIRSFLRWRYARLVLQIPLLILALFVLVDGFTGRQLAPRNVATTSVWLHYRGLVVLALAFIGNAFCAACPLMLTRGLSRQLKRFLPNYDFPQALKNKYLVVGLMLLYFFSYEYFDLWASPWLTAWLAVGYFASALVIDTFFPAGTFCRYVCPLGNFNFVLASASPTQIIALDSNVCQTCQEKPCLHGRESYNTKPNKPLEAAFIPLSEIKYANGSGYFPGCETKLFVPTIESNMDCTLCFNCLRACPYDNVGLGLREPTREASHDVWRKRGKFSVILLGVLLCYYGMMNAVAMIPPYFRLAEWIAHALNSHNELLLLSLFFVMVAALGLAITTIFSYLADLAGQSKANLHDALMRWGYVTLILGIGFWTAHYLFHFLTGALSIIPVFQHFFSYRGFEFDPNWRLSMLIPSRWLFPINASITVFYAFLAIMVSIRIALRDFGRRGVLAMWPMILYVLLFMALAIWVLAQPMEMRGTIFGPSY